MENICKFLVRLSIVFVSLYFIVVYLIALIYEVDFHNDIYISLLELCLAVFTSVQGNYHCKYARYTAWGIFSSDTTTRLDGAFNFLPVSNTAIVSSFILFGFMAISIYLAFRHFIRTVKINNQKKKLLEKYGTGFGK